MNKFTGFPAIFFLVALSQYADALTSECPDIVSSDPSINSPASIIGLAKDPKDNKTLYCEYHYRRGDKLKSNSLKNDIPKDNNPENKSPENNRTQFLVEYRSVDQKLIAQKKLSYQDNLLQPEVIQKDLRHGERREVMFSTDNKEAATFRVQYQKPDSKDLQQREFPVSDSLVVDAGFDEAVRQHWVSLLQGETINMDFLSPVHLNTFNLSMRVTSDEQFIIDKEGYEQTVSLLIRPSNGFINLFAKPLLLTYEKTSQRLLAYKGNVNITSNDGGTLEAIIQYYYR